MGIGGSILDAMNGANYANEQINRGEDRARQVKLNAMTDEVNTGKLEDYRRERADASAMRDVAAGSTSIAQAADRQGAEALGRGRVDLAQGAAGTKLSDLGNQVKMMDAEFAQKYTPIMQAMQLRAANKQTGRQGDIETIEDQKIRNQMNDDREHLLATVAKLVVTDQKEAARVLSESPTMYPDKKVSGFMESADGKNIAIVGENGEKLDEISTDFVKSLIKKYTPPPKYQTLKPGEALVREPAYDGTPSVALSIPPLDSIGHAPQDSVLYNKHGGAAPAQPSGLGGYSTKRQEQSNAHQDTRFKVSENVIANALGGTFNALGKLELPKGAEVVYQKATVLAEEAIKRGVDPARAASDAVAAARRDATVNKLTAPPPGAKPAGLNDFDLNTFVTP